MIGVIGGSGFIGSWLVGVLLRQKHSVRIIDKQPSRSHPELWTEADVRDPDSLREACRGLDVLYNLAAEHRDDVEPAELYHTVNVDGAHNTCAAAETLGIRKLIFTSTVAVYGFPEGEIDETAPMDPFNEYGRTKLEAERAFRAWAERAADRSLAIVRPTVVFGPGNRGNVYNLLAQVARGRNLVVGDGTNRKSMAYVENVADFLAFGLRLGPGLHLYNYVDKPDLDMNELVSLTSQTLGGDAKPRHVPYGLALGTGLAFDLAARLMGRRFPISAVRVRKYGATSRFAAQHLAESGFVPRHDLRRSLIACIEHEFCPARETTKSDERIA